MRRLIAILTLIGVTACQDKVGVDLTLPTSDANVAGAFNLESANGQSLPYDAILTTTELWDIASDQIVIDATGGWVDTTNYIITTLADGTTRSSQSASAGTYTLTNGQINFVMTQGGTSTFVGSVVGTSLYVNFNGQRYFYTK